MRVDVRFGRFIAAGALVLAVSGCATGSPAVSAGPTASPVRLGPAEFAAEVDAGERVVVNVHVPDEGTIEGTSTAIPFDLVEDQAARLPPELSTPLAVYCLTDRMSEVAVATLTDMGYTDVVELAGGMQAWRDSGRSLLPEGAGPPT